MQCFPFKVTHSPTVNYSLFSNSGGSQSPYDTKYKGNDSDQFTDVFLLIYGITDDSLVPEKKKTGCLIHAHYFDGILPVWILTGSGDLFVLREDEFNPLMPSS